MRRNWTPMLALGVVLAVAACGTDSDIGTLETVEAPAAAEVLETGADVVLLDIRTPEEYAEGKIAGSANIDFYAADFRDRIAALDRDVTYVVYCRSGNRSDSAMNIFEDLGFNSVYEIQDGILGWAAAGLPIDG